MLDFDRFGPDPQSVPPGSEIGSGIRLAYDRDSKMVLGVRRTERLLACGQAVPTLHIHGQNRAPEDWFGIEIWLPHAETDITMTARNYPAQRLFPRFYYQTGKKTGYVDLPDAAASDSFHTRLFEARRWAGGLPSSQISKTRLSILVPSTVWFVMEIQDITLGAPPDA